MAAEGFLISDQQGHGALAGCHGLQSVPRGLCRGGEWWRFALLILVVCWISACRPAAPPSSPEATDQAVETQAVTLGGRTFHLELALDEDTRFQGLSDRAEIAADGGMLFVFPEARRMEFVMRKCLTDIDIVFLGPNGRVLSTHAMKVEPYDTPEAQLERYGPRYPAQFAIELAGGTLEDLGLSPGDAVDLPLDRLKDRAR